MTGRRDDELVRSTGGDADGVHVDPVRRRSLEHDEGVGAPERDGDPTVAQHGDRGGVGAALEGGVRRRRATGDDPLERRAAEGAQLQAYALMLGRSPRLGRPDDIAAAVAFLFSEDAEWINGQVLSVDGGTTVR